MTSLPTKCHMPDSSGSPVIAIISKAMENLRTANLVCTFYIIILKRAAYFLKICSSYNHLESYIIWRHWLFLLTSSHVRHVYIIDLGYFIKYSVRIYCCNTVFSWKMAKMLQQLNAPRRWLRHLMELQFFPCLKKQIGYNVILQGVIKTHSSTHS